MWELSCKYAVGLDTNCDNVTQELEVFGQTADEDGALTLGTIKQVFVSPTVTAELSVLKSPVIKIDINEYLTVIFVSEAVQL